MKTGKKRYFLHTQHDIGGKQENHTKIIYRVLDKEARAELMRIRSEDSTAQEGYAVREHGDLMVAEFCKYV